MEISTPLRNMPGGTTAGELERLLGMISRGVAPRSACAISGISPRTYRGWKTKGREILEAIERDEVPPLADKPLHQEAYVNFYLEAEKAEGMFDARLDLELAKRVDKMDTRDLIRMRESRAAGWGNSRNAKIQHGNDPDNPMPNVNIGKAQIIQFSPELLQQADAALLEAGIANAEASEEEDDETGVDGEV